MHIVYLYIYIYIDTMFVIQEDHKKITIMITVVLFIVFSLFTFTILFLQSFKCIKTFQWTT